MTTEMPNNVSIAVLIPCYNEEIDIAQVVLDFREILPDASIYVYDNNSGDNTVKEATRAGAYTRTETRQGKGHVVQRMFRDIDADFYIMVDGDNTYDAKLAPSMIKLAMSGPFDLVNCIRCETENSAYREGHRLGNQVLTKIVQIIFGNLIFDMLSGYKVFSRRFVKSFPVLSTGFDIETELTVHALELSMPVAHVRGFYHGRSKGSESKLHTYRDGWRILVLIVKLVRYERPLIFFGIMAGLLTLLALFLIAPVLETGLIALFPATTLPMGIMLLIFLNLVMGIILDSVARGHKALRLLAYLQHPPPPYSLDPLTDFGFTTTDENRHQNSDFKNSINTCKRKNLLLQQVWRFGIVGVIGYIVNAGIVELLAPNWGPLYAQILAFPIAASMTWWFNRHFTFGASERTIHREWLQYLLANSLGWVVNNGAYVWIIFNSVLAYQHPSLAVAAGSLAGMIFNFTMSKWLVFNKPTVAKSSH